jgi:hypothetical protein
LDDHPLSALSLEGLLEPPAVGPGLDDVCVERQPVDHGLAQPRLGEHLGPLAEREVGGDDEGGAFGALVQDLEQLSTPVENLTVSAGGLKYSGGVDKQQLRLRRGERHVGQLVEDQQLHPGVAGHHLRQLATIPGLQQLVDQAAVVMNRTRREAMQA